MVVSKLVGGRDGDVTRIGLIVLSLVIAELTVHRATPGRIELYGELRCYGLDGTCREVAAVRAVVETL